MSETEPIELPNADLDRADRQDKWRTAAALLGLALVIAIAWAMWSANSTSQDRAESEALRASAEKARASSEVIQKLSLAQQVVAACADPTTATDLGTLCARSAVIVKQGPKGDPGVNATTAQIEGAVAVYLTDNPPAPGRDGKSPDPAVVTAQIRAAVVAYASTHLPDDGIDGRPGVDGTPGTDGAASTVPGPGPTNAQVSAAVKAYCDANDFCRGPAGPPGPRGPAGQPAPTPEPTPTTVPTPEVTP